MEKDNCSPTCDKDIALRLLDGLQIAGLERDAAAAATNAAMMTMAEVFLPRLDQTCEDFIVLWSAAQQCWVLGVEEGGTPSADGFPHFGNSQVRILTTDPTVKTRAPKYGKLGPSNG